MKITIGREEISEYIRCRFELHGNKLKMKNIITDNYMNFLGSKSIKIIPPKYLPKVSKLLKENDRLVL